jgi:hypothetical protein
MVLVIGLFSMDGAPRGDLIGGSVAIVVMCVGLPFPTLYKLSPIPLSLLSPVSQGSPCCPTKQNVLGLIQCLHHTARSLATTAASNKNPGALVWAIEIFWSLSPISVWEGHAKT